MTDMMKTKAYFLKMVASIICEQPTPAYSTDINLQQLYKLAVKNSVQGILYLAIKNGNIPVNETFENNLRNMYMTFLMRDAAQEAERAFISNKFSEENIDFMFLKGSHLKKLYPTPEIRYMVDMDILIHEKDMERGCSILLENGFTQYLDNVKDVIFTKKPAITVELHKMLFIDNYFMHDYFLDVWEKAVQVSEHEYKMSDNDLYVYTLAHLAEHYLDGGSCFRPTMDLFLMERKLGDKLDFTYINQQFKAIGIDKFAEKIRLLYNCMFADGEYNDDLTTMENYIVLGAPVKDVASVAKVASSKQSKMSRIITTLFPKYAHMVARYPLLKKVPLLLPFFWLKRIFRLLFTKNEGMIKKRKNLINTDSNSVDIMREIFEKSGF